MQRDKPQDTNLVEFVSCGLSRCIVGRAAVSAAEDVIPPLSALTGLPPWVVMWALALMIFVALKLLTWQFTPVPHAPAWRHVAYLVAWPGLDARAFIDPRPLPREQRTGAGE
jgi:hypothetical protein